jgi:hypothetical protein
VSKSGRQDLEHQDPRRLDNPERELALETPDPRLERLVDRRLERVERELGQLRQILDRLDSRNRHLD